MTELKSLKFKNLGAAGELKSLKFKKLGSNELKSLKFKDLGSNELKSLKFKDLGAAGELKSLKFKKDLGKNAPEHVRSQRILDKDAFTLTKLGSTASAGLPFGVKMFITILLIAFLVFRLKMKAKK